MTEVAADSRPAENWRKLYAYGWPAGSVRALMALIVFGTLWALMVLRPDRELPEYLRDLLFIILGHYFAVRGRNAAASEPGPPPLFLPRGSVRLLLIGGFVISAVWLYRKERLLAIERNPAVVTLLLVAGFLLGVVLRQVAAWFSGRGRRLPRFVEDLRATISLLAAVALAFMIVDQFLLPKPILGWYEIKLGLGRVGPQHLLSAVVGFYFGSRS